MSTGEYSAAADGRGSRHAPASTPGPVHALTLALALVAAGACDTAGPPAVDDRSATGGELAPPPFVASSRSIDAGRLSVALTVGADDVPVVENGGVWTARFSLPDDSEQVFPIEILWSYAVGTRTEPIPIARAIREIELSDSRSVRVAADGYETSGPGLDADGDADGDGRDNFTEIDEGTDPLVADADLRPVAPGENQDDCNETVLPGERAVDASAGRDLFRLGPAPLDETISVDFDIPRLVYHATLFLETSGTITIEHDGGLPLDTNATVFDRQRGATGLEGSANVQLLSDPIDAPDGARARVSGRLDGPGLYCFALFDGTTTNLSTGAALTDLVLGIRFAPDAS